MRHFLLPCLLALALLPLAGCECVGQALIDSLCDNDDCHRRCCAQESQFERDRAFWLRKGQSDACATRNARRDQWERNGWREVPACPKNH